MAEKKTKRKVVKEVKNVELHWTAFDEGVWGETKVRNMLEQMFALVEGQEVFTLEGLQVHFRITPTTWAWLIKKYDWFKEGIEVVKRAIYNMRVDAVVKHDKSPTILKDLYHYSTRHAQFEVAYQKALKDIDTEQKIKLLQEARKKSNDDELDFGDITIHIS